MSQLGFKDIPPLLSAKGSITLPGSKSISNRMLLLAALAQGTTQIRDVLLSDDTARMLEALQTLGVQVVQRGTHAFDITGCGGVFPVKKAALFLGNAGTAFRPLTAVLALAGGEYQLSGVARMHERPIGDLVNALRALGAEIEYTGNEGFPPLAIKSPSPLASFAPLAALSPVGEGDVLPSPPLPEGVRGVKVRGDVSSQFLTALLMALPLLNRTVQVEVVGELISKPYIDITLTMMARFGVVVQREGWQRFTVAAGSRYISPEVMYVEGDASSASYFLAAGAIGGGAVRVEGVGRNSIQGDVRFADALALMGAQIEMGDNWMSAAAPASGRLTAIDLDCNHIPDAAMTLAVAALFADGTTTLRNIASWRVKETDRIAAMATELRKVGATVEEGADYIHVTPPAVTFHFSPFTAHSAIDTYDDHRMAMCFSLAAFGAAGIRINDPNCVAKTFPDYFERFAQVVQSVPVIAIDGPSASGKGTVSQRVADHLGFHYLDSGALYRLLAAAAMRDGIELSNESAVAGLAGELDIRFEGEQVWLDGVLMGEDWRGEDCAKAASQIAALPLVRAALLAKQQAFRRAPGLVADGRDMASVVFPDAVLKIFLTASAQARAERRDKQLKAKGMNANIAALLQDIQARDARDMQRSSAPLQQVAGATLLDTTNMGIEQAVEFVLTRYHVSPDQS
ncbi:MAG: bifunctional 3-phosphoshikimate 1-carboxyvinyltransferase/cytidylate kinase [Gallionella sp.]|nr:bifunctional 3-phosphoshikimate 1-carboxyvinyltransferase/cytidylate kinase [Gallionella sp.]MDD4958128.1 bifunctional 3-phosphoshikimate 1-carboxyvinyltransferase/cytidylate kinase [Gallionella sp.]